MTGAGQGLPFPMGWKARAWEKGTVRNENTGRIPAIST